MDIMIVVRNTVDHWEVTANTSNNSDSDNVVNRDHHRISSIQLWTATISITIRFINNKDSIRIKCSSRHEDRVAIRERNSHRLNDRNKSGNHNYFKCRLQKHFLMMKKNHQRMYGMDHLPDLCDHRLLHHR